MVKEIPEWAIILWDIGSVCGIAAWLCLIGRIGKNNRHNG